MKTKNLLLTTCLILFALVLVALVISAQGPAQDEAYWTLGEFNGIVYVLDQDSVPIAQIGLLSQCEHPEAIQERLSIPYRCSSIFQASEAYYDLLSD